MLALPQQPLPDRSASEVVVRVRAKWREECEGEIRRWRRQLQAFTPEQRRMICAMLISLVDAALLPVARYAEAADGHEQREIGSVIALLLAPGSRETRHAAD